MRFEVLSASLCLRLRPALTRVKALLRVLDVAPPDRNPLEGFQKSRTRPMMVELDLSVEEVLFSKVVL